MTVLGLMHASVVKEDNRDMLKDWMCKLGYLCDRFANFFWNSMFFSIVLVSRQPWHLRR